jgi:UDP-GlcNAc:undecaprenyl-phosphate/decaprenyl-phosphate GlcNAc-1-phosphate transferase
MDELLLKYALLISSVTVLGAVLVLKLKFFGTKAKSIDTEKRWAATKPALGGLLFLLSIALGQLLFGYAGHGPNSVLLLAFTVGFVDDMWRMSPWQKLMGQFAAAFAMGIYVYTVHSHILEALFFTAAILVMMNSINMLDNMDGVATIGSLPFWFVGGLLYLTNQLAEVLPMLVLIGCLVFLLYNAYPSKMFMGDSGSMLLGAMCVVCMYFISEQCGQPWYTFIILWMFISTLTLSDTALVVVRRLQHKKSPMQGGKDHSTHHLVYWGWSTTKVSFVFTGMALFQGLVAFAITALSMDHPIVLAALLVYTGTWFIFIWNISRVNLKSGKFDYSAH